MPIATLRFTLPEEQSEFDLATRASSMAIAIEAIGNELFRPARKHGYSDPKIVELMEKCGEHAEDLVGELERRYYEILEEYNARVRE